MLDNSKTIILEIRRQENSASEAYTQSIPYVITSPMDTVASALTAINTDTHITDTDGNPITKIAWECSCLQQKCGACAMVIDGVPRLACDAFLNEFQGKVTVEPLKKFPLIKDLMVDRSIMQENLRQMKLWHEEQISLEDEQVSMSYDASRCLQCGCCLEVCPNYSITQSFYGAAAFVPTIRLFTELTGEELNAVKKQYKEHIYAGCGKSLACKTVCPAGIDTEKMLVKSNAIAFKK